MAQEKEKLDLSKNDPLSNDDLLKTIELFKQHTEDVQSLVEKNDGQKSNQYKLEQLNKAQAADQAAEIIKNIKKRQNAAA